MGDSLSYLDNPLLSANHNSDLRCVICTGGALFALLSTNQNRVIFSCILLLAIMVYHSAIIPRSTKISSLYV